MIKSEAVHCTALTKGEKFLHNKISYEIYSEAGTYHKQHGIENQDAVRVGCSNDTNCFYCCMSDGASFCPKAENVAWCTVDNAEKVLRKESISSINENDGKRIAKEIVLKIRSSLYQYAIKNDLEFEKLCSTLIIFYINLETKEYMIIHIGDGLVGNIDEENSLRNHFVFILEKSKRIQALLLLPTECMSNQIYLIFYQNKLNKQSIVMMRLFA